MAGLPLHATESSRSSRKLAPTWDHGGSRCRGGKAHRRYVEGCIALSESRELLAHPDQAFGPGYSGRLIGLRIITLSFHVHLLLYNIYQILFFMSTLSRDTLITNLQFDKHGPSNSGRARSRSGAPYAICPRELRICISTDRYFHPPLSERS